MSVYKSIIAVFYVYRQLLAVFSFRSSWFGAVHIHSPAFGNLVEASFFRAVEEVLFNGFVFLSRSKGVIEVVIIVQKHKGS